MLAHRFAIAAALVLALARAGSAAEPLQAQLDAGEFAPALETARASSVANRDQWLAQIAAAQDRAGARVASLSTAAQIEDDVARSQSLSMLKNQPLRAGNAGLGGGSQADFDALIDLIVATVQPQTWDEVGGPGAIQEFEGGVRIDAEGTFQRLVNDDLTGNLAVIRADSSPRNYDGSPRRASPLRKVSLTRLERLVQLRLAAGERIPEEMHLLGGLQRVKYVLIYPETGDIVLAGPADDWTIDHEGRIVGRTNGRPVMQLDDLVVILRHMSGKQSTFGCSIDPRREALAKTQEFLNESAKTALKPGQRTKWLNQLRDQMGRQDIKVNGIDPRTRVAQVLVEADYRMKLVGLGLEESVVNVPNYLEMIKVDKGQPPPKLDVLRWWFTLDYQSIQAAEARDAFEIRGPGVKLLSENELLNELGQRRPTGDSEPLNRQFALNFTKHFAALGTKYPIYAELQNICDLALVAALLKSENIASQVGWHMTCFGDPAQYVVELGPAPRWTETVINHRVINQVHIVAAVSGGVRVDPASLVQKSAIQVDNYGQLKAERGGNAPAQRERDAWWWD